MVRELFQAGPTFQSLVGRLGTDLEALEQMTESGFQSLIGRLGTFVVGRVLPAGDGFQSLIGRLGTQVKILPAINHLALFQSLIGRLGTSWAGSQGTGVSGVSIPHR